MKRADIKIGMEAAVAGYGLIAKVRVLETGLPSPASYKKVNNGVRFEVIDSFGRDARLDRGICETRELEPWSEAQDERLARLRAEEAYEARVARVAARLGVSSAHGYGGDRLVLNAEDFFELAQRLGVEID